MASRRMAIERGQPDRQVAGFWRGGKMNVPGWLCVAGSSSELSGMTTNRKLKSLEVSCQPGGWAKPDRSALGNTAVD